jgi:hypothetical protein
MNEGYMMVVLGGPTTNLPTKDLPGIGGGATVSQCQQCSTCAYLAAMKTLGAAEMAGVWIFAFPSKAAADSWQQLEEVKPKLAGRLIFGETAYWDQLDAMRSPPPAAPPIAGRHQAH